MKWDKKHKHQGQAQHNCITLYKIPMQHFKVFKIYFKVLNLPKVKILRAWISISLQPVNLTMPQSLYTILKQVSYNKLYIRQLKFNLSQILGSITLILLVLDLGKHALPMDFKILKIRLQYYHRWYHLCKTGLDMLLFKK